MGVVTTAHARAVQDSQLLLTMHGASPVLVQYMPRSLILLVQHEFCQTKKRGVARFSLDPPMCGAEQYTSPYHTLKLVDLLMHAAPPP